MFWTYLRSELTRRRRQTVQIAVALGLAVGLVVTVTSVAAGVRDAQSTVLASLYGVGTDVTVTGKATASDGPQAGFEFGPPDQSGNGQPQQVSGGQLTAPPWRPTMAQSAVAKAASVDGVSAATGVLQLENITLSGQIDFGSSGTQPSPGTQPGQGESQTQGGPSSFDVGRFSVDGVETGTSDVGPLSATTVTAGRAFTSADARERVALVDRAYATSSSLEVGDTLKVAGKKFEVVGIVKSTTAGGSTAANVYVPLWQAQQLSGLKNKVSAIDVRADSAASVSDVKAGLKGMLPDTTVSTSADLADQVSGSLSSASTLADDLGRWLAIGVLLVAFLLAALLTASTVARRTREFGTLKAIGWRSRRVVGQVMGESVVRGLLGGVLGVLVGLAGVAIVNAVAPTLTATVASVGTPGGSGGGPGGFTPPGGGGGGPSGMAAAATSVTLEASVAAGVLALAVALSLAGGLLAGAFGGWRASRLRPADALRSVE